MKILLHTCCGPCAIYCVKSLREKKNTVEGLFYNPNIHPVAEYDKRKEALITVSEKLGFPVHFYRDYSFEDFFRKITFHEDDSRCPLCWQIRLKNTAEFAKRAGFDAFTTTLLISPYQDQNKIKEIGEKLQEDYSVKFYFEDFNAGFKEGHSQSRNMGIYHQKYCGCIYSERERMGSTPTPQ